MNSFKYALAGAALALAPISAYAATITSADSGTNYDLLANSYSFDEDFMVDDAGGTLTFSFTNNSGSTAAVTYFGSSVEQNLAAFTDGVDVTFGTYSVSYGEATSNGENTSFIVGAGDTVTLSITYGTVFDLPPSFADDAANIDFSIQAALVLIPAAGLLLLTALAGAFGLRRRKTAA